MVMKMKKNVAIWGWWQGKNLGDNWIKRTLREVFPNYEFIDTSVMDFSPYDFVICGGGGLYIYDVIEPWRSHTPPIPYGMLGLGAEFPHASSRAEELCSKSEFFFLRDQYSLDCMKIKNVERSYDVTFLRPLERKEIQSINLDKLLFVWRDGQELTRNPKFREYIQYSDNFEQWKKVIQAHFNCIERNDFQTTADNIEAAMENCGFVISGRFHGIAAAIQKGIPCIAIDICPKIRALMEDCGLKEYCIKVSETDKLGELIIRAKAEYRDIRKKQQDYKAKANLTLLKHIEVVKEAIDRALHPLRAIHYGSYWMGENDVVKAMADDLGDVFISQVIDLKAYSSHSDTRIKECTPTPNGMLCVLSAESIQTDIARYKPDVLIFNSGGLVPEEAAFTLMKEQKIISVGISLSDPDVYPYNGSVYAHKFDLFYTNSKHSYQHDYKKCSKIHLLPFAASTKHHYFLPDEKRIYDIVIVGHARPDRLAVVTELEKQFCVGTFGSGWPHSLGVVHGFEHIQAINRGKMYLSFAKTNAGFDNVKVGLFEAVACNQVVITKYMEELSDYFTIGSEIICYHSEKEIPDIVRGLLESPRKLEEIRANAYRRFLQEHTYGNRWMRVKKDIENSGKGCKENDRTNREYVQ